MVALALDSESATGCLHCHIRILEGSEGHDQLIAFAVDALDFNDETEIAVIAIHLAAEGRVIGLVE
jgi:hypothetical protein